MAKKGTLYLIPAPLGESFTEVLPPSELQIVHQLNHFVAERAKTARSILKAWKAPIPFAEMTFFELNKRTDPKEIDSFLVPLNQGISMGLISEAGCPGVADPGSSVVRLAHINDINVHPMIGPSSILLALMGSGLDGQSFSFNGYLPIQPEDRKKAITALERTALSKQQTQLFMDTPYRNITVMEACLASLGDNTLLGIACDLTLPTQYISTKPVKLWKKNGVPDIHKRPAIFMIGSANFRK